MNTNDAQMLLTRVLHQGEQVLVFEQGVALPSDDPGLRAFMGSSSQPIYVAVTPARLIEIQDNGNVDSGRWSDMASLFVSKSGRQWRYQWQRVNQRQPYAPIQVSKVFAEVLQGIQGGSVSLMALPPETTTYTVVDMPHDNSSAGRTAAAVGMAEKRCICDACGSEIGIETPFGEECMSCCRTLQER